MNKHWRKALFVVLLGLALAACGGDDDLASDAAVDESTTTEAPATTTTTTTAAPTTTAAATTEAPESTDSPSASVGVSAFGTAILNPENIEGLSEAEAACVRDGVGDVDSAAGFDALAPEDQVRTLSLIHI